MKKIKIILNREIEVEVLVDETIINEEFLNGIEKSFNDEIFDEPESCVDNPSRYECGLYNYAKAAAMAKADISEAEYITLEQDNTKAKILSDYLESSFEKIENVD